MPSIVVNFPTKNAYLPIKYLYLRLQKGFIMYRDKLIEIKKAKGIASKQWAAESGVSIDTINRIIHPENPEKDSPRVNTLEDLCRVLGVELWEIFYTGNTSLVSLQSEISDLKSERDSLLAENAILKDKEAFLRNKVDTLKDELLEVYRKIK